MVICTGNVYMRRDTSGFISDVILYGIVKTSRLPLMKELAMQTSCAFILELWCHSNPKIKLYGAAIVS